MRLSNLRIFSEVAKYGSITRAAQEAYISPPAVSKAISKLEDYVGHELFDRVNNRLYLNEYGEIVLEAYNKINTILSEMQNSIDSFSIGKSGRVTVAMTFPSYGYKWINECLKEYRINHEYIFFSLVHLHRNQIPAAIKNHDVDFALTDYTLTDADINWRELYRERLALLLSKNSPFAQQSHISLYDVRNEPFVDLASQHPRFMESDNIVSLCQTAGFTPNIVFRGDVKDAVENEVAEGRGMLLISERSCKMITQDSSYPLSDRLAYCILEEDFCYRIYGIASAKDSSMPPAAANLYDAFINADYYEK